MIDVIAKQKETNRFSDQVLPKPRDLYAQYGPRAGKRGVSGTTKDEIGVPVATSRTVISQLSQAQKILDDLPQD